MKVLLLLCFFILPVLSSAQADTIDLNIYFLYGSKPKKEFKRSQRKWFGGILGGHVGIEIDSNKIIDFLPSGKLHIFPHKKNKHSNFVRHTEERFWEVFGNEHDEVKKAIVTIPISLEQKEKLDSIVDDYFDETPYDYAFFGMRCGASTYEILAQLGIFKRYNNRRTIRKIFYPKKLRRRLFRLAEANAWTIKREEGTEFRKWEQD